MPTWWPGDPQVKKWHSSRKSCFSIQKREVKSQGKNKTSQDLVQPHNVTTIPCWTQTLPSIWCPPDDLVTVRWKRDAVHIGGVATELLQRFPCIHQASGLLSVRQRWNSLTVLFVEVFGHKLESSQTRVFVGFSTLILLSTKCFSQTDSSVLDSQIFLNVFLKPE